MPLRIGFDGRAFSSPAAGVRRYARELVRGLLALDEPLEIVALGGTYRDALQAGIGHVAEPVHPPTNAGWTLIGLPLAAARAGIDLIHAPAYTAPFRAAVPVVLTIHDVSYARRPEFYPYRLGPARRWFYRRSAQAAAHVLTDSQFSASEITAAYAIPPDRITVAPLGVSQALVGAETGADMEGSGALPPNVTEPFLLHVGDLHERRNLAALVDALLSARRSLEEQASVRGAVRGGGRQAGLSLVLAGVDRGVGDGLSARGAAAGAPDAVVRLGAVSDAHLRVLYKRSLALVYPSLYEGFGLPLVEAMASGTPVLASDAASIPEVVGDAAVVVNPHDVEAWAAAIVKIVTDDTLRARLRSKGLLRAATFTWERTAAITAGVYRAAVADRGSARR